MILSIKLSIAELDKESEYNSDNADDNTKKEVNNSNDKELDNGNNKEFDENKVEDLQEDLEAKETAIMVHNSKSPGLTRRRLLMSMISAEE